MKLPISIRYMILGIIIKQRTGAIKAIVPANKPEDCNCPILRRESHYAPRLSLPSAFGPELYNEFFRLFFRKTRVRFRCCCELNENLAKNERLVEHVQTINVHWCGPESAKAFKLLAKCPRLESLTITVSKATLCHFDERAELMRKYFPIPLRNVRMTDILGLDELLEVRGLHELMVQHLPSNRPNLAPETDRANLAELLRSKLKQPREVRFHALNDRFLADEL